MGRPEKKKAEALEKYLFISSPAQIIEKMETVNDENRVEIFESITEKLQQNYPAIWQFISRVINIPIELVNSAFDVFMGFNTTSRNIILNYLKLGEEYKDIYVPVIPETLIHFKNENLKDDKENERIDSILSQPLIKAKEIKNYPYIKCIISGHRSALIKDPKTGIYYRLKGCGNDEIGFNIS